MRSLAESIGRQIRAWANRLQNSPIKGQRYLNDRSRAEDEQDRRAKAFMANLDREHRAWLETWSRDAKVQAMSLLSSCSSRRDRRKDDLQDKTKAVIQCLS